MRQDMYEMIVNYIIENQEKFYRLAYTYARNQDDALDIVQNAVCKALDHYKELRNENAVKTWFYRILVNESYAFIKKRKRELPSEEDLNGELPYYEQGYDTSDEIYEQINRLDEDVQRIIKLRYFEELTLKEISDVMKLNLNTVKAKLYRGLKLMRQNLQEAGV